MQPFDMALIQRGARLKRSPYFEATQRAGCRGYTVYNHMFLPIGYADLEQEYWKLLSDVTVWDVSVERNVEIAGRDGFRFASLLTPRDLSKCRVGQGKYVLLTAEDGGIVNDPVLLRLEENRFWLAAADSDVLLWAKGVAYEAAWTWRSASSTSRRCRSRDRNRASSCATSSARASRGLRTISSSRRSSTAFR